MLNRIPSMKAHLAVISLLNSLDPSQNLRDNSPGVCAGISVLYLNAFFCGKRKEFERRLDFIVSQTQFVETSAGTKKTEAVTTHILEKISDIKKKIIQQKHSNISAEENQYMEILGFLESVKIANEPNEFPEYFSKPTTQYDFKAVFEKIYSSEMEKLGGITHFEPWSGIYNKEKLIHYLASLDTYAKELKQNIAFVFDNDCHRVEICYEYDAESKTGKWIMTNPNRFPYPEYTSEQFAELADKIILGFKATDKAVCFATTAMTATKYQSAAKKTLDDMQASEKFKTLHPSTTENMNEQTESGLSRAYICAQRGLVKELQKLVAPEDDNKDTDKKLLKPIAVKGAVKDVNIEGHNLALVAAQNNHPHIIDLLGQHSKVNLSHRSDDGVTPAYFAAQFNFCESIKVLEKHHADLNHPRHFVRDGKKMFTTPAMIAAINGHVDALKALAKAGVDLTQPAADGRTPLFVAQYYQQESASAYLCAYAYEKAIKTYLLNELATLPMKSKKRVLFSAKLAEFERLPKTQLDMQVFVREFKSAIKPKEKIINISIFKAKQTPQHPHAKLAALFDENNSLRV